MDKLIVHGGSTLEGSINISGSKNASLPILAAALLTEEDCIIRRVPDVSDTNYMIQILSALGADVERSSGTVRITCAKIEDTAPYELVRRMRASICVMGPLLARLGKAVVSLPGGCVIGDRPADPIDRASDVVMEAVVELAVLVEVLAVGALHDRADHIAGVVGVAVRAVQRRLRRQVLIVGG